MDARPAVELTNLYLTSDRGEPVFENLEFRLEEQRAALVVGPAGSGKSSLIDLLLGRRAPDSGSVELFGECIDSRRTRHLNKMRRKIGGVGGIFRLIPSLTVAQNIAFPMIIAGVRRRLRRERLRAVLAEFSLLKQADVYPDALTRVEDLLAQFARASAASQSLLVADEPLAGLDPKTHERVLDHLIKVTAAGRSMLILSSGMPEGQLPNADSYRIEAGRLQ